MKFTVEKSGERVSLAIEHEGKARRVHEISVSGRIFVKGKPPEISKLMKSMETHCLDNNMDSREFLDLYHKSRQHTIEHEMKELLRCFMKIQNSLYCIDIANAIRFSDSEK